MRKLVQEKMADAMQMPNQNSIHIGRLHIRWIREDTGRNRKIAKHVNGGRQPFVFFEVGEVDITIHTFPNSTLLGRVLMTLPTVMTLLNLNLFNHNTS